MLIFGIIGELLGIFVFYYCELCCLVVVDLVVIDVLVGIVVFIIDCSCVNVFGWCLYEEVVCWLGLELVVFVGGVGIFDWDFSMGLFVWDE